jgi:hypothetical protein
MTDAELVLYKLQRFMLEPQIKHQGGVFDEDKFNQSFAKMLDTEVGRKAVATVEQTLIKETA